MHSSIPNVYGFKSGLLAYYMVMVTMVKCHQSCESNYIYRSYRIKSSSTKWNLLSQTYWKASTFLKVFYGLLLSSFICIITRAPVPQSPEWTLGAGVLFGTIAAGMFIKGNWTLLIEFASLKSMLASILTSRLKAGLQNSSRGALT